MNNVPYNVGCALIGFNICRCVMGKVLPGVEHKQQHNRDGRRQLLRSSAAAVFILPLVTGVVRMWACAPIIAKVRRMLQLQEVS